MNKIWLSLRYTSTIPVRGTLVLAALGWGLLFLFASPQVALNPVYTFLFSLASQDLWSALFLVDAALLLWRMVETRTRVGVTRLVNAYTCGLWALFLACSIKARGYVAPDCADDIAIFLAAVWCTLRTDLTVSDRESA